MSFTVTVLDDSGIPVSSGMYLTSDNQFGNLSSGAFSCTSIGPVEITVSDGILTGRLLYDPQGQTDPVDIYLGPNIIFPDAPPSAPSAAPTPGMLPPMMGTDEATIYNAMGMMFWMDYPSYQSNYANIMQNYPISVQTAQNPPWHMAIPASPPIPGAFSDPGSGSSAYSWYLSLSSWLTAYNVWLTEYNAWLTAYTYWYNNT